MEALNENEAMRVLQAAAALDARVGPGASAPTAPLLPSSYEASPGPGAIPPAASSAAPSGSSASASGGDAWKDFAETEDGVRKGDLDTWLVRGQRGAKDSRGAQTVGSNGGTEFDSWARATRSM